MDQSIFYISGRSSKTHAELEAIIRQKGAKDGKKRFTKSVTHVLLVQCPYYLTILF